MASSGMSDHKWYDVSKTFPLTSRVVVMRFDDGGERDAEGFFWAPERSWYRSEGGKAKRHSVHPVAWREKDLTPKQATLFE